MKKLFSKLCNRETIAYLFFGVLTTLVNFVVFNRLNNTLGPNYALLSNGIAFVAAVIFAYLTNKPFVFRSMDWSWRTLAREIPLFFGGRIVSFLIEEGLVAIAKYLIHAERYSLFGIDGLTIAKVPIAVIVVILNYIFSKTFAFRKRKDTDGKQNAAENNVDSKEEKTGEPQA